MANIADAVKDLQQERSRMAGQVKKLDKVISVLRKLTRNSGPVAVARRNGRKRRSMSAAARRRISLAQRARWAKWKEKHLKKAA
jgi:hypothetical protein